jgi:hypothetical protein
VAVTIAVHLAIIITAQVITIGAGKEHKWVPVIEIRVSTYISWYYWLACGVAIVSGCSYTPIYCFSLTLIPKVEAAVTHKTGEDNTLKPVLAVEMECIFVLT